MLLFLISHEKLPFKPVLSYDNVATSISKVGYIKVHLPSLIMTAVTLFLTHPFHSVAEIPTKDNMPALDRLPTVVSLYKGVDDTSDTPKARKLWHERLTICQNSHRLKQLFASHGFFVHLEDYNLPGIFPKTFSLDIIVCINSDQMYCLSQLDACHIILLVLYSLDNCNLFSSCYIYNNQ